MLGEENVVNPPFDLIPSSAEGIVTLLCCIWFDVKSAGVVSFDVLDVHGGMIVRVCGNVNE